MCVNGNLKLHKTIEMSVKRNCIVKNEKFELFAYEKERPLNFVLEHATYDASKFKYHIAESGVDVLWTNGTYQKDYISFSYKVIEFKRILYPTIQGVVEQLNLFLKMSESEIELLAEKAGKTKVDELNALKQKMISEIIRLKETAHSVSETLIKLHTEIYT